MALNPQSCGFMLRSSVMWLGVEQGKTPGDSLGASHKSRRVEDSKPLRLAFSAPDCITSCGLQTPRGCPSSAGLKKALHFFPLATLWFLGGWGWGTANSKALEHLHAESHSISMQIPGTSACRALQHQHADPRNTCMPSPAAPACRS